MNETPRRLANAELGASTEEFQNLHEFVQKARANLDQNAWDYIVGAAETETTMRRNRMALDEIAFRPRVLRNVARVDASAEVFGRKLRLPVMMAPVGALEIFDPAGAAASVARGVGRFGAARSRSPAWRRSPRQRPMHCASISSMSAVMMLLSRIASAARSRAAMRRFA